MALRAVLTARQRAALSDLSTDEALPLRHLTPDNQGLDQQVERSALRSGKTRPHHAQQTTKMPGGLSLAKADVCLILEGSYPFVFGGVSGWTQSLITGCNAFDFGVIAIRPAGDTARSLYPAPANLVAFDDLCLDAGRARPWRLTSAQTVRFGDLLCDLATQGRVETVSGLLRFLDRHAPNSGVAALLNGPSSWAVIRHCYDRLVPGASFSQFYWAWRGFFGAALTVLRAPLPKACVYHAVSTGFAGLMAARAALETGRPVILTEHGIYTNERRIDLMLADWVHDSFPISPPFDPDGDPGRPRDIRDFWIGAFASLAKICYDACSIVISLSDTARREQVALGAAPGKCRVIPNGVDVDRYGARNRKTGSPPCIALVGRVVAIKDIANFLAAVALLQADIPELQALIVGPDDEEPDYARECRRLCTELDLDNTVQFTGTRPMEEVLDEIDLLVLTSLSESQPLVLLEAGAAGVACVATDVGACRDVIMGPTDENPPLGAGGRITRLDAPEDIAAAIHALLSDDALRTACGAALKARVTRYYREQFVCETYSDLYRILGAKETEATWQA